jgi:chain length determinant protein EpsF
VIDIKSPDPINGLVLPGAIAGGYIATQIDIIRSERVSKRVINTLKLKESPQLRQQWQDATEGRGVFDTWLSEVLQKNLDVLPSKESTVITVSYTAVDPNFAAAMSNAFIQAYLDTTIELRVEPARRFSSLFNDQLKTSRERLEQSQTKLSEYQRAHGLIASDERIDVETMRLSELSSQLVGIQSLSAESRSRQAQAGNSSAEVLNNPVVSGLKADMSRQEARLKELSARFGSQHPQVQELQASIAEMAARIDAETQKVTRSMGLNNTVNESREAQARASLEAQRAKLLQMKATRDEAAVLLRDVENSQRAYDMMQGRYSQTNLESTSDQTNVSILKMPTPPANASSPRVILNSVAAGFFGLLIGMGAAVARELSNRKLRTEEDLLATLGATFMGIMPVAPGAITSKKLPVGAALRLPRNSLRELAAPGKKS